ncbi:MAG: ABC transporter permease [Variovorax paradoxus]|nr:MAG: ABC transporter permease [Variovorax paradoxus]PZQ00162.1 MAG: ABC transporter permease [Variovorax paradoxus]
MNVMNAWMGAMPLLLQALGQTLLLAAIASIIAMVVGFLMTQAGILGGRSIEFTVRCVVEAVRGVPLLVFILLTYYALPKIGIRVGAFSAGAVALGLFFACFVADILRGAFKIIPRVQTEAGKALGMGFWRIQTTVLLPQVLRVALPPLMNLAAIVIKATSVVSMIGVWELTMATNEVVMRTMAPFTFFLTAMFLYFVLCYGTVRCAGIASSRLNLSQRK